MAFPAAGRAGLVQFDPKRITPDNITHKKTDGAGGTAPSAAHIRHAYAALPAQNTATGFPDAAERSMNETMTLTEE